jgi:ribose 5-phosphate isomerase B
MSLPVALAADHGGFDLKSLLLPEVRALGREALDLGTFGPDSVDYADYADAMAAALRGGRAGLGHDGLTARLARQHNDANILVLGGRVIGPEVAKECLRVFLSTAFEGGRHARRIAKFS